MLKKLLTEFIGTFFLIFTVGCVVTGGGAPTSVIAIGIVLMTMVYMGGHISGAHYNPAVTIAMLASKKINANDAGGYLFAQIVAGFAAAYATQFVAGKAFTGPAPGAGVTAPQALVVEILFTFALVLVIFNVAVHKKMANNPMYGFSIGGVIVAAAYAGGPISGGAFNPAVAFGPIMLSGVSEHLWIYLVGPIVGGLLAAGAFTLQTQGDEETA
jgi:aquaporin Z